MIPKNDENYLDTFGFRTLEGGRDPLIRPTKKSDKERKKKSDLRHDIYIFFTFFLFFIASLIRKFPKKLVC